MIIVADQIANLSAKPPALLSSLCYLNFSTPILTHRTSCTSRSVSRRENPNNTKVRHSDPPNYIGGYRE